jgi:AraC-like DNA-binding protein
MLYAKNNASPQGPLDPAALQRIEELITQAKTRLSIAQEYGIDPRTLRSLLHSHGIDLPKGLLLPKLQRQIYEILGPPPA